MSNWTVPTEPPSLGQNEIHVWAMSLECSDRELEQHRAILADDENQRADKFIFDRHRRRFAVGRSCLRQLLGHYTSTAPERIEFEYANLGKPRLAGHKTGQGLCFNFSNSHERALFAITHDVELGVDVEQLRPMESLEGLAERYFAKAEKDYILPLEGRSQLRSFFECWTRKEAFLKAIGKGLTFPLRDVTIELDPALPVDILEINDDKERPDMWRLTHLTVDREHVGALACRRLGDRIQRFRFEPTS